MYRRLLTVFLGLLLGGCLTSDGGGPAVQTTPAAQYGRIVVAAVRMPPEVRTAAEARLSEEIGKRGVKVIALSSLDFGNEPRTPQILVRKILQAGARAVFVIDPFVYKQKGKTVVKTVMLSGMREMSTTEVIDTPPTTYKAALYDVDRLYRAWMEDANSSGQRGAPYSTLATDAASQAVAKAIKAGVL